MRRLWWVIISIGHCVAFSPAWPTPAVMVGKVRGRSQPRRPCQVPLRAFVEGEGRSVGEGLPSHGDITSGSDSVGTSEVPEFRRFLEAATLGVATGAAVVLFKMATAKVQDYAYNAMLFDIFVATPNVANSPFWSSLVIALVPASGGLLVRHRRSCCGSRGKRSRRRRCPSGRSIPESRQRQGVEPRGVGGGRRRGLSVR